MIQQIENALIIHTDHTSYVLAIHKESKLLLHLYYGARIDIHDLQPLMSKLEGGAGTAILYEGKKDCWIDSMDLEVSTIGKGDYRESSVILYHDELGYTYDFKYQSYQVITTKVNIDEPLANSKGFDEMLIISLIDDVAKVKLELCYKVFSACDVIAKFAKLTNESDKTFTLERLMSNQLDFSDSSYQLMTFDGAWGKERFVHERPLVEGIYINDSKTGMSSNRHNPLTILKQKDTSENQGEAYGFNLVYSGNHQSIYEVSITQKLRVLNGMSFFAFKKNLKPTESFMAPECILTYSQVGLNGISQNFHRFVNHHIIAEKWRDFPRPIVINNWEATYFHFSEAKLLKLAKVAKKVGIELFVLDDGWFGHRDDDTSSLGDYSIHKKKLPHGLAHLAEKIHAIGLDFGLWVEPEMISIDSDLYRSHPSWAITVPGRTPSMGRNQLMLDLANQEVQGYIIEELTKVFSSCDLQYVKWDYNRPMTDMYSSTLNNQGEFFHSYIQGLYHVLDVLTKRFPKILFEGCASGGNRFDLGILCFMPQIWTSDNTDYYDRLKIQTGTSYGYPLSCISNHVSTVPNHQTLRITPLHSRFHNACFGVLGYEMNLTEVNKAELQEIKDQIVFYKQHRKTFQYGTFYRHNETIFQSNHTTFTVTSPHKEKALVGYFQGIGGLSQKEDIIKVPGLKSTTLYSFYNLKTKLDVRKFGSLINTVLPIHVKMNGTIYKVICYFYQLKAEEEHALAYGSFLSKAGIKLSQQFMGTGYSDKVRLLGDFGSRMYVVEENTKKES